MPCAEIIDLATVGAIMVVTMQMRDVAVVVRVDNSIGKAAGWHGKTHAKSGRNGKQQRERPGEGGASSAGLLQSSDHAPAHSADQYSQLGILQAHGQLLTGR